MNYYNAKEAAQYLGVNERTIRKWIQSGHLKAKKAGRFYRISKRALDSAPPARAAKVPVSDGRQLVDGLRAQVEYERQEREKLRQENMRLMQMLGQAESQIKMLEAPKEVKKQKRRWFWGRKK